MAACDQRFPVHEEEPHIAVFRFGEDLLSDDVAVASDGLDHLVEIRRLVVGDEEDARATRSLQRFEHCAGAHLLDEGADVAGIARDERPGPHRLGEVLEVGLVHRVGEAGGIVHDQGARGDGELREQHSRRDRPGPFRHVLGRDRCA